VLFTTFLIPGILSLIIPSLTSPSTPHLDDASGYGSGQRPRPRTKGVWRHFLRPSAQSLVIASFPLITFFGNLYYTDVASLAGVLGAWALARRERHGWAALVSDIVLFKSDTCSK
jgi:hypothetical protein